MATKKGTRRPATKRPAPRRPERQLPESLRLRSLAVSLTVNDLGRSLAWYRDGLRFTVGERWQDGGQLRGVQPKAGGRGLKLNQAVLSKGRDPPKGRALPSWPSATPATDALAPG